MMPEFDLLSPRQARRAATGFACAGLAALLAIAMIAPAAAQSRPDTRNMTCSAAQSLVDREGAITLSTGRYTYARFVSGTSACRPLGSARPSYVPTQDQRNCQLLTCRIQRSSDGIR